MFTKILEQINPVFERTELDTGLKDVYYYTTPRPYSGWVYLCCGSRMHDLLDCLFESYLKKHFTTLLEARSADIPLFTYAELMADTISSVSFYKSSIPDTITIMEFYCDKRSLNVKCVLTHCTENKCNTKTTTYQTYICDDNVTSDAIEVFHCTDTNVCETMLFQNELVSLCESYREN